MKHSFTSGFTLTEMMIVMGIIAIIFTITSLSVSSFQPRAGLDRAVELLVADLKQQQLSALSGSTEGRSSSGSYGIYLSGDKYFLFQGSVYSATDATNYEVKLDDVSLTTSLPGGVVVFNALVGDIKNFTGTSQTFTLTSSIISDTRTIIFNKYGALLN